MSRFYRRRKICRFTAEGVKEIDYKDLDTLKQYITETGKIGLPYHRHQRALSAPAGTCDQARPLPRAAAVRRQPRLIA